MHRLTDQAYWDERYREASAAQPLRPSGTGFKAFVNRLLGPRIVELMQDYCEWFLWDVIYEHYLPQTSRARVLEVGSAPGDHLVHLQSRFGYVPYGIEYSEPGAQLNRRVFRHNGIGEENVMHGDFFSPEFQNAYRSYFDIVVSRGFVEHFTDLEYTIASHLNVLRRGGHLIVTIPNLRGLNYLLTLFFNKGLLSLHNTAIMRREVFHELFQPARVTTLLCRYYGTFNIGLFFAPPNSPKRYLLAVGAKVQRLMNVLFRLVLRNAGADSRYSSPYLIFIGVKQG